MSNPNRETGSGTRDLDNVEPAVRILDAVNAVRRHPEWFFRGPSFDTEEVVGLLTSEALRGGATVVTVTKAGPWVSLLADRDWLNGDLAAFHAPQRYSAGGRNSARVEVALTAFCRAVVTVSRAEVVEISSEPGIDAWPNNHDIDAPGRLVAFVPPAEVASDPSQELGEGASRRVGLRLVQGEGERSITSAVNSFLSKAVEHG